MYAGPIHSQKFVQRLLDKLPSADTDVYGTLPRLNGMLKLALDETLPGPQTEKTNPKDDEAAILDHYPFYFTPSRLSLP